MYNDASDTSEGQKVRFRCQQCFQDLQIQQIFPANIVKENYDSFQEQIGLVEEDRLGLPEDERPDSVLNEQAIFFGQTQGEFSNTSDQIMLALRIQDFADHKNLQVKLNHPVCFECFEEILKCLDEKVKNQEQERDMYKHELLQLEKEIEESQNSGDDAALLKQLEELELEENGLDQELQNIETQEKQYETKLKQLDKEKQRILSQEDGIWQQVNNYEQQLSTQLESKQQLDGQTYNLMQQYKRLRRTNFINEVFHISSMDQYGTISGFRLGRIEQLGDVKWEEINTALGQTSYLMAIIAHRFGYKFDAYKINLCGSMSTIQLRYPQDGQKNSKYPLYYDGRGADSNFNTALEFLLDCLYKLQDFAMRTVKHQNIVGDRQKTLLYKIEGETIKNKIGGQSIKYKSNDTQTWTASMKFFLTNLQWLVYMSQLRDIQEQQENVNMQSKEGNFNLQGL